jgi:hypothetical protein
LFLPNISVPATGDVSATALQQAPDRHTTLDAPALDALLVALGDFVDLKCPFTHHKKTAITAALAAVVIAASGSVAGVFDPCQGGTRPTGGDADTAPAVGATLTRVGHTPRWRW